MGKKTNWTLSEDQALCRAWLCASDAALSHAPVPPAGDQRAGTFWGFVHQVFHAELETSVDRPVTGLKIRWTRINRDVQRFALAFARVQAAAQTSHAVDSAGDREAAAERERQAIDEATELFLKEQGSKFTFESCWRLLRFSPRWMQLLANSAGVASTSSAFRTSPAEGDHAAALALQKRRLSELLESQARALPESSNAYLAAIAQELARQSDLLEEQNAIALFRMDLELVDDDAAREYFAGLRHTYAKRMRREETAVDHAAVAVPHQPDDHRDDDAKETANL